MCGGGAGMCYERWLRAVYCTLGVRSAIVNV